MGGKTPAAPPAPDPVATAQAQGTINMDAARYNSASSKVDQYGPTGSVVYTRLPSAAPRASMEEMEADALRENAGNPNFDVNAWRESAVRQQEQRANEDRWQATTTLSPSEQRQLDLSNQASEIYGEAGVNQLRQAQQALSQQFNPTLPQFTGSLNLKTGADFTGIGDPNQSRDAVEAALYQRLNPQLNQARLGAENRLRNQGLVPGSEAWNNAIRDVNQSENDARLAVTQAGGAEQSRMFGLGFQNAGFSNDAQIAQAGFGNSARNQSFQEQLALRNQPVNEVAALLSGQMIQMPQFSGGGGGGVSGGGMQAADYLGAQSQYQTALNNQYNAQVSTQNANTQGMYSAGAAGIAAAGSVAAAVVI